MGRSLNVIDRQGAPASPAGIADGFNLRLFVDQVPNTGPCRVPLGIATNNLGQGGDAYPYEY